MPREVTYTTADGGTDTVTRDMTHVEKEPLLTAYDENGEPNLVQIPVHRVVRVDEVDTNE